jgi:ERF superfamily
MTKTYDEPDLIPNHSLILIDDKAPAIFPAMIAILAELPAIGKNQRNQQQGFNFRGIDDVQKELTPLMGKHGVFLVPEVLERVESVRTTRQGTNLYVVSLHVRYTFYAADGSSVTASAWGEGTDSGDKATPKAMTGALKYVLFQAFNIATEESSRSDADHETQEPSAPYVHPPEGWASIEEHDAWRHQVRDRAKALPLDAQGEFAGWWQEQVKGRGWKWPLTGEQADEYSEQLAAVEAKVAAAEAPL